MPKKKPNDGNPHVQVMRKAKEENYKAGGWFNTGSTVKSFGQFKRFHKKKK